jgi:acyl-CoA reductase-like NAD-dependent aldehyde dehydrogenase
LGSSIYSNDRDHAEKFMETVRSGMVFINEVPRAEPTIPIGGVGRSGYGRESGLSGFREFANIRTYYVN